MIDSPQESGQDHGRRAVWLCYFAFMTMRQTHLIILLYRTAGAPITPIFRAWAASWRDAMVLMNNRRSIEMWLMCAVCENKDSRKCELHGSNASPELVGYFSVWCRPTEEKLDPEQERSRGEEAQQEAVLCKVISIFLLCLVVSWTNAFSWCSHFFARR